MPGLHVCHIAVNPPDARGEWVEVANDGSLAAMLTGRMISDYTATQQNVHIYDFPPAADGTPLTLPPGKSAYVFTGAGTNQWTDDGHLLFFAHRAAPIWNNTGDVAYLREANGQIIDTMTVGHPKRHPHH